MGTWEGARAEASVFRIAYHGDMRVSSVKGEDETVSVKSGIRREECAWYTAGVPNKAVVRERSHRRRQDDVKLYSASSRLMHMCRAVPP